MGTATEPQVRYLTDLLNKREVNPTHEALLRSALAAGSLGKADASHYIDILRNAPVKRQQSAWAEAEAALADVEVSFYALPAGLVSAQHIDLYGNDFLFLRVRNMSGGRKRLSRVSGAPGSPSYRALPPQTVVSLAALMRGRHVEYAQNWHKHSGRCGKCNAVLTDKESRERGLGPDCAKMFGV